MLFIAETELVSYMAFWNELRVLLWKNFTVKLQQRWRTSLEILIPLFLFVILALVRLTPNLADRNHECHFDSKATTSAGFLPFIQSYFCTYNNACNENRTTDGFVGKANAYDHSVLSKLAEELELLFSASINVSTTDFLDDYSYIQDFLIHKVQLHPNGTVDGNVPVYSFLKTPEAFNQQFRRELRISTDAANTFTYCSLTPQLFVTLVNVVYKSTPDIAQLFSADPENLFFMLPRVFTEVKQAIFCNAETVPLYFVHNKNSTTENIQKMASEICAAQNSSWTAFWFGFLLDYEDNVDQVASFANAITVVKNITDVSLNVSLIDCTDLVFHLRRLYSNLRHSGIWPFAQRTFDDLRQWRDSLVPARSNSSSNSSAGISFVDLLDTFTCGQLKSGFSSVLSEGSSLPEQFRNLRERFQGRTPLSKSYNSASHDTARHGTQLPESGEEIAILTNNTTSVNMLDSGEQNEPPQKMIEFVVCSYGNDSVTVNMDKNEMCHRILEAFRVPGDGFFGGIPEKLATEVLVLLRGFILVCPKHPAVDAIVQKLTVWLNTMEFVQESVRVAAESVDNFNSTVSNSSFASAATNFIGVVLGLDNFLNHSLLDNWREVLVETKLAFETGHFVNGSTLDVVKLTLHTFNDVLKCFRSSGRIVAVNNEYAAEVIGRCLIDLDSYLGAVVFKDLSPENTSLPSLVTYKIRMDPVFVDSTYAIMDRSWNSRPRQRPLIDTKYLYYGFSFIQDAVDKAIIELHSNSSLNTGVYLQQFPSPCYQVDMFVETIKRTIPLFMTITWIYTFSGIVKTIVYEREKRLKEIMKIHGLTNFMHWLAFFITSFTFISISVVLLVLLIKLGSIIRYIETTVLIAYLFCFAMATIAQAFLVSTFFNKSNLAAACAGFIYFVLYLPYSFLIQMEDRLSFTAKVFSCLDANVAFGWGCSYIALFEEETLTLTWFNLSYSPVLGDNFSFIIPMLLLLLDTAIYLLIAGYVEAVFPGQYGIARSWYFPVQRSFWLGSTDQSLHVAVDQSEKPVFENDPSVKCEAEPTDLKVGVSVRNLRKVYNNGKVAVDNLSLNFYEGQVTSFLGHNGAGKTTSMSIMTGLLPATSGSVYVLGRDVQTEMDVVRKCLGMCPQHNVLFDSLSVEQQLYFYARLKGVAKQDTTKVVDQILVELNLERFRKMKANELSGGMQRKLSIAIAFIGDSKTVILDEPTAGVDPYARRGIWDLILLYKPRRTVILSTHHMDEADLLGDRIAIISSGRLRCCGSSLFLKRMFGSGYILTMVKQTAEQETSAETSQTGFKNQKNQEHRDHEYATTAVFKVPSSVTEPTTDKQHTTTLLQNDESTPTQADAKKIQSFVHARIPSAQLISDVGSDINFSIPVESAKVLKNFFLELDKSLPSLAISSYGLSDTTLEEIFMRVTFGEAEDVMEKHTGCCLNFKRRIFNALCPKKFPQNGLNSVDNEDDGSGADNADEAFDDFACLTPSSTALSSAAHCTTLNNAHRNERRKSLHLSQFYAVFAKRFYNFRRSVKGAFCEILLPIAFVALTMIVTRLRPSQFRDFSQPPLLMVPWIYGLPNFVFYSLDNPNPTLDADGVANLEALLRSPGLGTLCMKEEPLSKYGLNCPGSDMKQYVDTKLNSIVAFHGKQLHTESIGGKGTISNRTGECYCNAESVHVCDDNVYEHPPPTVYTQTSDYVMNLTGWNLSLWLLDTEKEFRRRRFGGISLGELNPAAMNTSWDASVVQERLETFENFWANFSRIAGFHFPNFHAIPIVRQLSDDNVVYYISGPGSGNCSENSVENYGNASHSFAIGMTQLLSGLEIKNNMKVWFNNKGWASAPIYANVLSNAMLRAKLPNDSSDASDYGIVLLNHPMNYSVQQMKQKSQSSFNQAFEMTMAIASILAFSFVPASFVLFLIDERVTNAKHLQFVSGLCPYLYWIGNLCWDMINFSIPVFLAVILFFIFNETAYIGNANLVFGIVVLIFLFGFSTTPFMYLFSFIFSVPSTAFLAMGSFNFFVGIVTTISTNLLEQLSKENPYLGQVNSYLQVVFLIFPQYCLGRGLLDMKMAYFVTTITNEIYGGGKVIDLLPSPFAWDYNGQKFIAMFVTGVLWLFVVLLIDSGFYRQRRATGEQYSTHCEDKDVFTERERVLNGNAEDSAVKLVNLRKFYSKGIFFGRGYLKALDQLCLGIKPGECFGLLGVNGAGKSTTFKILTGEIRSSEGDAYFGKYSVLTDLVKARRSIGYCPQFDALFSLLTGREHLEFFARLRGIKEEHIPEVVNWSITNMNLTIYADKKAGSYSGGNKRKLSTAIALIGKPEVVLLDEPTTGMDPKARRFLWNRILEVVREGRSVVLTSHSMEECEALCNRIGILVNGRLQCLGSVQHLKNRFGDGYTVVLKLGPRSPGCAAVAQFVEGCFPGAVLKESHHTMLQYQLPSSKQVSVSGIFQCISDAKVRLGIEDYSISQTTLDQVFINFAKQQHDAKDTSSSVANSKFSNFCCSFPCCRWLLDHCPDDELPLNDLSVVKATSSNTTGAPSGSSRQQHNAKDVTA